MNKDEKSSGAEAIACIVVSTQDAEMEILVQDTFKDVSDILPRDEAGKQKWKDFGVPFGSKQVLMGAAAGLPRHAACRRPRALLHSRCHLNSAERAEKVGITMAKSTPSLVPTVYNLSGDNATVSYATTSFTGRPELEYKTGQEQIKFSGEEIGVIDSEFGKLVTVTVGGADAGDTTLTLLIPSITVTQNEPKTSFDTNAIVMSLRKLGPIHQLYRVLNLHGTAEAIPF